MKIFKQSTRLILILIVLNLFSCVNNDDTKPKNNYVGNFTPLKLGNIWIFRGSNSSSSFSASSSFGSIRSVEIISETNNSDTILYGIQIRDSLFLRITQTSMDTPIVVYSNGIITQLPDSTLLINIIENNFDFNLMTNGFTNNLFDSSRIRIDTVNDIPSQVAIIKDVLPSSYAMSAINRDRYFIKDVGIGFLKMDEYFRNGSNFSQFKLIQFNSDSVIFKYP